MGKAIVIGIIIILSIVAAIAGTKYFTEGGKPKDFGICMACIFVLGLVIIFGGIGCF